jgi:cell filamentation protein
MYGAEPDPYCYPGTAVLKNRAGLTTEAELEAFETAMTFARSEEPLPRGRLTVTHYRAIHHHLFQDVYAWSGKYRTVRLSKGTSVFCYPEHIAAEMTRVFADLARERHLKGRTRDEFGRGAAHFLAELNAVHPFREGNGRTQLTFLALLAASAGHPLDLDRLDPERTLAAMIASFGGDEKPLAAVIHDLVAD